LGNDAALAVVSSLCSGTVFWRSDQPLCRAFPILGQYLGAAIVPDYSGGHVVVCTEFPFLVLVDISRKKTTSYHKNNKIYYLS
jgi:hypothetical protein